MIRQDLTREYGKTKISDFQNYDGIFLISKQNSGLKKWMIFIKKRSEEVSNYMFWKFWNTINCLQTFDLKKFEIKNCPSLFKIFLTKIHFWNYFFQMFQITIHRRKGFTESKDEKDHIPYRISSRNDFEMKLITYYNDRMENESYGIF